MNPTAFSELLTDISEEYIVSAAHPQRKPLLRYAVSAIAACIVLLIAAAVYPRLRMQEPGVSVPPVSHAEHTAVTTTETEQSETGESHTTASRTQSTASSGTAAVNTTADVPETASVTATDTIDTTAPAPKTDVVTTQPPQTDTSAPATHSETQPSETTVKETLPETTAVSTNPVTFPPQTIEIPIWKGITEHPESVPVDPNPQISSRFIMCPADADDSLRDYYHETFGIPVELDLTQHPCLLIVLETYMYQAAAVIGGNLTDNRLQLQIACLENPRCENSVFHFALPVPENIAIAPENYIILTDEAEYQALLTDSLTVEIQEQEGLL